MIISNKGHLVVVGVPAMRAWVKLMRHIERYVREVVKYTYFGKKEEAILVLRVLLVNSCLTLVH